jgi:hypothetical protein
MSPYAPTVQIDAPADAILAEARSNDAVSNEAFSLSRAFVATKEACRSFRSRVMRHGQPYGRAADGDESTGGPTLRTSATARSRRAAGRKPATVPTVLTPWDLLDEDPSPAGVTFAPFQQRPRLSPLHPLQQQQAA